MHVYFLSLTVWVGIIFMCVCVCFLYFHTKFCAHTSFSSLSLSFSARLTCKQTFFRRFACLTATEYIFHCENRAFATENMHILIIVPEEKSFNHFSFTRSLLSLEPVMVAYALFTPLCRFPRAKPLFPNNNAVPALWFWLFTFIINDFKWVPVSHMLKSHHIITVIVCPYEMAHKRSSSLYSHATEQSTS